MAPQPVVSAEPRETVLALNGEALAIEYAPVGRNGTARLTIRRDGELLAVEKIDTAPDVDVDVPEENENE